MFIDTHAHLYLDKFNEDIDQIMINARSSGVSKIYLPNIDSSTTKALLELSNAYPNECIPMMGLHPCSVKENYKEELDHVREMLDSQSFVAVGEIGLDYYWDKSFIEIQKEAYIKQIEWAKELGKPIVIHSRDSLDDTIAIAEKMQDGNLTGIFLCFNGTTEQMLRIKEFGFYIGLGGVITFKNAKLDEMIASTPMEMIVLETDAPYLSPVPYRGKRNESSYIPFIAEKVAEIKNMTIQEVAQQTTQNANKIFGS